MPVLALSLVALCVTLFVLASRGRAGNRRRDVRRTALLAVEALEGRLVPAVTMAEVRARIAAAFPAVANPATSDVVRVNLLRKWAYQEVDLGDGSVELDTRPSIDYCHRTLPELVDLFDHDVGSVLCGGDAWFLMKLYEAYGYTAGRVSVGLMPSLSHTVTLVQVPTPDGTPMTLIEDAHTNRTAVDVLGRPMSAQTVAELAREGRGDEVHWQQGRLVGRDLLLSARGVQLARAGKRWWFDPKTDSPVAVEIRPGVWKMHGSSTGRRLDRLFWETSAPVQALAELDLPPVFASAFAFPLWVDGLAGQLFARGLPPGNLQYWTYDLAVVTLTPLPPLSNG